MMRDGKLAVKIPNIKERKAGYEFRMVDDGSAGAAGSCGAILHQVDRGYSSPKSFRFKLHE
jgi:hypothetical protein